VGAIVFDIVAGMETSLAGVVAARAACRKARWRWRRDRREHDLIGMQDVVAGVQEWT
jgi:hypothetical protein